MTCAMSHVEGYMYVRVHGCAKELQIMPDNDQGKVSTMLHICG